MFAGDRMSSLFFRNCLAAHAHWVLVFGCWSTCFLFAATSVGRLDAQQKPIKLVSPAVDPRLIKEPPSQALSSTPTVQSQASSINVFQLHSYPSATKTIYLNFTGHSTSGTAWNSGGNTIVTAPFSIDSNPAFSSAELAMILEVWQRVAETYSPFDVDVTTEEPSDSDLINSGNGDTRWGIRVCIGRSTPDPAPGAGGVAYVGSFSWNSDTPCFVFPSRLANTAKYMADATSHEVGHSLGLSHDGRISPQEDYYYGHGSGPTSWAPVMGVGYDKNLVQWSKGEYLSANNQEDDLRIITTQNGFGYRPDDYADDRLSAVAIAGTRGTGNNSSVFTVDQKGLISLRTDTDWFKLKVGTGTLTLNAVGGGVATTMLDIQMDLYSSTGSLIVSSNPVDELTASISQNVAAGTYYLKMDGVGKGSALGTGYTDYGSLGTYQITGSFTAPPVFTPTVVKAVYAASSKTLTLTGDAGANSVTVNLQADVLTIEGANGTDIEARKEDGTVISKSSSYRVAHSGKLILNATMNAGDDGISVIGIDASTSNVDLGAGEDKAAFTLSNIGTLTVDGGPGTDIVTVTSSTIGKFNRTNVP